MAVNILATGTAVAGNNPAPLPFYTEPSVSQVSAFNFSNGDVGGPHTVSLYLNSLSSAPLFIVVVPAATPAQGGGAFRLPPIPGTFAQPFPLSLSPGQSLYLVDSLQGGVGRVSLSVVGAEVEVAATSLTTAQLLVAQNMILAEGLGTNVPDINSIGGLAV